MACRAVLNPLIGRYYKIMKVDLSHIAGTARVSMFNTLATRLAESLVGTPKRLAGSLSVKASEASRSESTAIAKAALFRTSMDALNASNKDGAIGWPRCVAVVASSVVSSCPVAVP